MEVAVTRQGVDGEGLEGVVEEEAVLASGIENRRPARGDEVLLDLAISGRFAVILRLADGEGNLAIGPLNDGGEPHVIAKDLVRGDPALQILQRRGMDELDGLTCAGIAAKVRHGMGDDFRDEAELRRDGDLDDSIRVRSELDEMLSSKVGVFGSLRELCPGKSRFAQGAALATKSTSLFGLVFREAGPVVPSTFEVVATKVA